MWTQKRRVTIRCLFSNLGNRQVTMHVNKQEQSTPIRREPSGLLALTCEYLAVFKNERTRAEAHV